MQVIDSNNMNNNLFYVYSAKYECFNFFVEMTLKTSKADFLYV